MDLHICLFCVCIQMPSSVPLQHYRLKTQTQSVEHENPLDVSHAQAFLGLLSWQGWECQIITVVIITLEK